MSALWPDCQIGARRVTGLEPIFRPELSLQLPVQAGWVVIHPLSYESVNGVEFMSRTDSDM